MKTKYNSSNYTAYTICPWSSVSTFTAKCNAAKPIQTTHINPNTTFQEYFITASIILSTFFNDMVDQLLNGICLFNYCAYNCHLVHAGTKNGILPRCDPQCC